MWSAFNFVIFQVFSTKHISVEQAKPEVRLWSKWDIISRIMTAFASSCRSDDEEEEEEELWYDLTW